MLGAKIWIFSRLVPQKSDPRNSKKDKKEDMLSLLVHVINNLHEKDRSSVPSPPSELTQVAAH